MCLGIGSIWSIVLSPCVYKEMMLFIKTSKTETFRKKYLYNNKTRPEKYKIGTVKLEQQAFSLRGLSKIVAKLNIAKRRTKLFRYTKNIYKKRQPEQLPWYIVETCRLSFKPERKKSDTLSTKVQTVKSHSVRHQCRFNNNNYVTLFIFQWANPPLGSGEVLLLARLF